MCCIIGNKLWIICATYKLIITNVYLIIIFFAFTLARISEIALLDKQSINSVTVKIVYLGQM